MNNFPPRRGFTLIELMVVVAIIGILATIVMVSLGGARSKARDVQRKQDIENFQGALEVYFSQNGHYPYTTCSGSNSWASFDSPAYSPNLVCDTKGGAGVTLSQEISPYITGLHDPKSLGGDSGYLYINQSGAGDYCILFWRTPENMNDFPKSEWPPGRCSTSSTIDSNGQCVGGTNSVYLGTGSYVGGC